MRGADAPDDEAASGHHRQLFFGDKRYDLGEVSRYKINRKLNLNPAAGAERRYERGYDQRIRYRRLTNAKAEIDDIDHLSNRRVRTVGEQLYAQFGVGLAHAGSAGHPRAHEREDNEVFTPVNLINAGALSSVINSFFGTSQLSQFLDQTNLRARSPRIAPYLRPRASGDAQP